MSISAEIIAAVIVAIGPIIAALITVKKKRDPSIRIKQSGKNNIQENNINNSTTIK